MDEMKDESAFPTCENSVWTRGISKRELFAAMAMQGLCANPEGPTNYDGAAKIAVAQADALLAALEGKGE
jgi:hypothetical protein